jgi:sulfite exporter TauE/SafE
MMQEYLIAAIATGLFGSLHCAGMCGPIAFSLPFSDAKANTHFYLGRFSYNMGRIVTYALMGALVGAFGNVLGMAGWQQYLSIIAGSILILGVLLSRIRTGQSYGPIHKFSSKIKTAFGKYYAKSGNSSLFVIGLLNGILPCGLVFTALAIALATGSAAYGSLVMVIFGLGTFPMMFVISISRKFLSQLVWKKFSRWSPLFALIIGVIFILRGANLGIPYLSPEIHHTEDHLECCH